MVVPVCRIRWPKASREQMREAGQLELFELDAHPPVPKAPHVRAPRPPKTTPTGAGQLNLFRDGHLWRPRYTPSTDRPPTLDLATRLRGSAPASLQRAKAPAAKPPQADAPNAPGLDLAAWWPDLRALVLSRYAEWIRREGLQLDDVLGEVAVRISASRVPFDPARCTPAVYLLIQARSAIVDLARKEKRWSFASLDPAVDQQHEAPAPTSTKTLDEAVERVLAASEALDVNDLPVVRLYLEGHTRSEILAFTGALGGPRAGDHLCGAGGGALGGLSAQAGLTRQPRVHRHVGMLASETQSARCAPTSPTVAGTRRTGAAAPSARRGVLGSTWCGWRPGCACGFERGLRPAA